MMKKLLLIPCLFIAFASQAQTKLTIQSPNEKCANVYSSARNTPGGDQGFEAKRGTEGTIRSFLQFDLTSIPEGSFVNWARLSLFSDGANIGQNTSLLRRITSAWDQNTVSWNTQPSVTKRGTVILPMSTSTKEDYKNINVTNLVQAMVDSPATSFGFALRLDSDANGTALRNIEFKSPPFNQPQFNPKLVMEYTAPGMQPTVTSMSADESGTSVEMTIYPNPCNRAFNCNIKSTSVGNMSIRVIDMLGRTVYSQPVNTSNLQLQINLPSNLAGTYFVILQDNKNTTLISQQLQVN